ncbi:transcriptional regulator [Bacillus sp. CLL-7-23]|uniref:Transcriptional regulator n=1 Tax=Bacillus changyiensis TaxID=3004103 RepID=A0ABT4X0N4_9BACI|nr:transcriptional regulator [Bacillus changyiensis]MDA7025244.1 transcriptional regulator [Bacillus changyiensis]
MNLDFNQDTLLALLLLSPLLFTQSILLFLDAKKKGSNAWFWGIWGLIQTPTPLLFYYLFVVRPFLKKRRTK